MSKPIYSLPPVAIVLLTYERTGYALRTIESALQNLLYGRPFFWIIADDGSTPRHFDAVQGAISADDQGNGPTSAFSQKQGYGRMANQAIRIAEENGCPITFFLEDDWLTERPFDITPYVQLLMEHDDIGMVRLGHLPVGLEAESMGWDGRMYLEIKKSRQYCYSGNPHLKHRRFFEHYGMFPEDRNPGDTEIFYDWIVREHDGPKVVWPLAIGDTFPFGHIGMEKSY